MESLFSKFLSLVAVLGVAGCTSVSSNYTGAITQPETTRLYVCHGFDCTYKTAYWISQEDHDAYAKIMAGEKATSEEERQAISRAIQYFENRVTETIGVKDEPVSTLAQARDKGQMDCIDESTNSRTLMLFFQNNGWLKHHTVENNVSRGIFIDARYPHSTAVLKEKSGRKWAVDSWFEPAGGPPDIMPLSKWRRMGVMGRRV